MDEQVEKLIRNFLEAGTANGLGDLSMMVSHIAGAYKAGERDVLTKIAQAFPVKEDGDFGLWTIEHTGKLKPTIDPEE